MKYISESNSSSLISHELAFNAVKDAFIAVVQEGRNFPVVIAEGAERGSSFSIKSANTNNLCGWKVGSYWASNAQKGIPCHASSIFLLDPETGRLAALIEASRVNAYRTAAADAVAVSTLAKKNASRLAIFGTGHQAAYECRAIAKVRSLSIVHVVGRDSAKSKAFADELNKEGLNAVSSDAKSACKDADIIVTATTSEAPLFDASWVSPGTHISAMGADSKGKQELPLELLNQARLFCDLATQSVDIGEFQSYPNKKHYVIPMIGDVLLGRRVGRISEQDITIFDSSGLSLQDLFIGHSLLIKAEEEGKVLEMD
ncbi:MAG: ornithine cyclodeaminase family protein [Pseudomonadales bacterium]